MKHTQNSNPKEATSDNMGQKTPSAASHGLLVTGSRFSDVITVNNKTAKKDTVIKGKACKPEIAKF